MRHLAIHVLTTSTIFLAFNNSVNANDCPPLKANEITVDESSGPIKLRTDPATEKQNIPASNGGQAVVNDGDKLSFLSNLEPTFNPEENTCYYPVQLSESNTSNTKAEVVNYKPYWISEKGIKDYQIIIKSEETVAQAPTPNLPPTVDEKNDSPGWSLPSWLPWALILILNIHTLLLLAYLFLRQDKKLRSIRSTQDRIAHSFQGKNLKLDYELQNLQSHIGSIGRNIGRNREHIKQLEELLKAQNEQFCSLVDFIKSGSLSLSKSKPLNQQIDRSESTVFGAMYSPQVESYQPKFSSVGDQDDTQDAQQDSGYDPFYNTVISEFNAEHSLWFENCIQDGIFQKAQMPKYAINGMNPDSPLIELVDHGVYLIFNAADTTWLIPDCTQPKWKRAITSSLFNGGGKILIRPAELTTEDSNLWRVIRKGEFTNG